MDMDMGTDSRYSACRGIRIRIRVVSLGRLQLAMRSYSRTRTEYTMHLVRARACGTASPPCKADAPHRSLGLREPAVRAISFSKFATPAKDPPAGNVASHEDSMKRAAASGAAWPRAERGRLREADRRPGGALERVGVLRLVWDGVYRLVRGADADSLPRGGEHRPRGAQCVVPIPAARHPHLLVEDRTLCTAARGPADGFEITLGGRVGCNACKGA